MGERRDMVEKVRYGEMQEWQGLRTDTVLRFWTRRRIVRILPPVPPVRARCEPAGRVCPDTAVDLSKVARAGSAACPDAF